MDLNSGTPCHSNRQFVAYEVDRVFGRYFWFVGRSHVLRVVSCNPPCQGFAEELSSGGGGGANVAGRMKGFSGGLDLSGIGSKVKSLVTWAQCLGGFSKTFTIPWPASFSGQLDFMYVTSLHYNKSVVLRHGINELSAKQCCPCT